MKPTIAYIKEKFDKFNKQYFCSKLPPIEIRLSNAATRLGCLKHKYRINMFGKRENYDFSLWISCRFDLSEDVVEDTIIHEMIHYFIAYFQLPDTGPHGALFRKYMNEINRISGRNIAIRHDAHSIDRSTDHHSRRHYFCITEWDNGLRYITVCASTCIFKIHRAFTNAPEIIDVRWYYSTDSFFNKYPNSQTARAYRITDEEYDEYVASAAFECVCDGSALHLKKK
jgi:predicted SprT family Zn-dependent metalloprotease